MSATLVARQVPAFRPFSWLQLGWQDTRKNWLASGGYGALVVGFGWTLLVFGGTHPYFVAAAISGFLLLAPIVSAGFAEMSRRYSLGESATFDDSLEGFKRDHRALWRFGLVLGGCAVAWFGVSAVMLSTVFDVSAPDLRETMYRGFADTMNRAQVTAYVSVGGILAAFVFTLSVATVPLIIDRHAAAGEAMWASIRAVFSNIPAMIVWSALILVLTVIGYAPLLFGLLIVSPILGHATWHAYRDLIRAG